MCIILSKSFDISGIAFLLILYVYPRGRARNIGGWTPNSQLDQICRINVLAEDRLTDNEILRNKDAITRTNENQIETKTGLLTSHRHIQNTSTTAFAVRRNVSI